MFLWVSITPAQARKSSSEIAPGGTGIIVIGLEKNRAIRDTEVSKSSFQKVRLPRCSRLLDIQHMCMKTRDIIWKDYLLVSYERPKACIPCGNEEPAVRVRPVAGRKRDRGSNKNKGLYYSIDTLLKRGKVHNVPRLYSW